MAKDLDIKLEIHDVDIKDSRLYRFWLRPNRKCEYSPPGLTKITSAFQPGIKRQGPPPGLTPTASKVRMSPTTTKERMSPTTTKEWQREVRLHRQTVGKSWDNLTSRYKKQMSPTTAKEQLQPTTGSTSPPGTKKYNGWCFHCFQYGHIPVCGGCSETPIKQSDACKEAIKKAKSGKTSPRNSPVQVVKNS